MTKEELLKRIETGTDLMWEDLVEVAKALGWDDADSRYWRGPDGAVRVSFPDFFGSIDAIDDARSQLWPGSTWSVYFLAGGSYMAQLNVKGQEAVKGNAADEPRARLAALVRAVMS